MSEFDYINKGVNKLSSEFKENFVVSVGKDKQGNVTEAVTVDGLLALAHVKGLSYKDTEILQYPNAENKWTCICKTVIRGYDHDPITGQLREVEYSDIADANEDNCGRLTAKSYIRMASTRSLGRALRAYTNIGLVCAAEVAECEDGLDEKPMQQTSASVVSEVGLTKSTLLRIKTLLKQKGFNTRKQEVDKMIKDMFNLDNIVNMTGKQAVEFCAILSKYPDVTTTETPN